MLRGGLDTSGIPVIAIFDAPAPLLRRQLMQVGVSFCLVKPLDINALSKLLFRTIFPDYATFRQQESFEQALERDITRFLRRFGISTNLRGFQYLQNAISRIYLDPQLIHRMTKSLYPAVAADYDTTASCVERAIRHALEQALERSGSDAFTSYFGCNLPIIHSKPTNSEFIALIADQLRIESASAIPFEQPISV